MRFREDIEIYHGVCNRINIFLRRVSNRTGQKREFGLWGLKRNLNKTNSRGKTVERPSACLTWLYLALATSLVSILPYWGGLQENSTKSSSCSKMAGYMTCRFSGPTQMDCSGEGRTNTDSSIAGPHIACFSPSRVDAEGRNRSKVTQNQTFNVWH